MEKLYSSRNRLVWEKNKVIMLGHMAGVVAAEEFRNVRNKKPRNKWKDRTAMAIDCFRNRRQILTVVHFTERSRNKGWRNVSRKET